MKKHMKTIVGAALIVGILVGGTAVKVAQEAAVRHDRETHSYRAPDWTVLPCSAYSQAAGDVQMPKYTRTDVCVTPEGRWEAPVK